MSSMLESGRSEPALVARAIGAGRRDANDLTNMVFYARHPAMTGRRIGPRQRGLAREWIRIRDQLVKPALAAAARPAPARSPAAAGLRTTAWLRAAWRDDACAETRMIPTRIFGTVTPVNPLTRSAFAALEQALRSTGYRPRSVWNYNCRDIKGQPGSRSLHAYGLALDIDPACNPHRQGAPGPARFSTAATQQGRCRDTQAGVADTAFTRRQVEAVEGIRTLDGLQVFTWGGRWARSPDSMHFQINVSPKELRRGIGTPPTSDIVAVGRRIEAMGYHVSEHPQFGGVRPVHSRNSYHYVGRAIDVNWYPAADEPAKLDQLYAWIRANVPAYKELLWRTTAHYDHLHLAI